MDIILYKHTCRAIGCSNIWWDKNKVSECTDCGHFNINNGTRKLEDETDSQKLELLKGVA